jgi:hypothetical protein
VARRAHRDRRVLRGRGVDGEIGGTYTDEITDAGDRSRWDRSDGPERFGWLRARARACWGAPTLLER